MKTPLPIDPLLPEIVERVRQNPITLLEAEPGAGKTTRVPAALLAAGLEHVYVLEPRRLAARMAAKRVSDELGERLGETVGYQVRFEEVSSSRTRLWYFTEGVLTRKLLSDREPRKGRVVILDEFHERHLETDLALSLLRKLQERRKDLRLLIMSATLAGDELSAKLGGPPLVRASGRVFPVTTSYTPESSLPLEEQVASAVKRAVSGASGHTLIFLPGAAEIRKAIQVCEPIARQAKATLLPLHGDLAPEEQDLAVAPSTIRKIICSTNVAESSITIDGVDAVIDSGLARVAAHSPWSGLSRLQVEKISKASAIQRAGRAGRTGPGVAIRLFSESDFIRRPEQTPPEILRADLAQMLLQLAASGLRWNDLSWIDEPPGDMRKHCEELLVRLHAFDDAHRITQGGRVMAGLPVHPRIARFLLESDDRGAKREAAELAARLSEGRLRLGDQGRGSFSSDIDALLATGMSHTARRLMQQLLEGTRGIREKNRDGHAIEKAFLCAYPDRVARKRGETLLLSNGGAAKLDRASSVHGEFLVAIEVDDRSDRTSALVRIASAIEPDWLLDLFPERIEAREEMSWNREGQRVEQTNILRYDQLTIDESRSVPTDLEAASRLLADKAIETGVEAFTDAEELNRFLCRIRFVAQHAKEFMLPADFLESGMRQLTTGLRSFAELREVARNGGLIAVLQSNLPMRLIDEIAPTHVVLPAGRRAKIEYHEGRAPSVASRLQDFFGMKESPTVARGAVPLVVHLLAPNHRPVQMTTDLVSFWKNLYPQVRRELSRRYPKHAWPEIPG